MKASKKPRTRRTTRTPKPPNFHEQITPGAVSLNKLAVALDALQLDPVVEWLDDDIIHSGSHRVAEAVFGSFTDLDRGAPCGDVRCAATER